MVCRCGRERSQQVRQQRRHQHHADQRDDERQQDRSQRGEATELLEAAELLLIDTRLTKVEQRATIVSSHRKPHQYEDGCICWWCGTCSRF
jgi:hypothetical protein